MREVIRILLIEDDEDDSRLVRAWLRGDEETEFRIEWVSTYETGLAALRRMECDICLLDYRLGAKDGLELLEEAAEAVRRTPTIFLTGQRAREIDLRAMRLGAVDYLVKDQITAALLERAIRYALVRKEHERAITIAKDKAESATRLKDSFVALVAHDMKSPLIGIVGALEYLLRNDADEAYKSALIRASLQSGKQMLETIDALLNINRLQTGRIELKLERFHLRRLVERAVTEYLLSAREKGVTIENRIPEDATLFADSFLVGEVLKNLLSNAIKFSRAGDAVVFARDERRPGAFTLRDEGVGIPASFLPDLFEHSVKTTGIGTAGERGTGFGLPYCHDIMTAHQGTIEVSTEVGKGSVFTLVFPA